MSLKQGLVRAGRTLDSPRKSLGGPVRQLLTLDDPASWMTGADAAGMSRDRAMKLSAVARCVEVLSNSMAVLPVYIMNEGTKERLAEHRLGRLLWERTNEAMTAFDYERLMMCNQLLRGNAYAWIYRDRGSGYPRELIPLPPDYVTIQTDRAGRVWYFFTHPVTGEATLIRQENMLHYKAYSEDGIQGVSVLRRASLTLDTARAAQQYERSTWRSGGQPSGILTTDADLGSAVEAVQPDGTKTWVDPKEQLRRSWEAVHRGPDNAFRVAVLDLGLKYQPISMSNADAQFVESSELRVADIARHFGVPLHLVFVGKESYASNEQNSLEFVRYTLMPYETQWSQTDTTRLLLPSERQRGLRIKRNLKVFLKGDTAAQSAWYKAMREMGVYSVNDIRALEDLPAAPGGDARYSSLNYVPLEEFTELSRQRAAGGRPAQD